MKKSYMVFDVDPEYELGENTTVFDDMGNLVTIPNPFASIGEAELFIQHYGRVGYHYTIIETYLKE